MVHTYDVGVDTGGTFTDIVCYRTGELLYAGKFPSTPADPSAAILTAIQHVATQHGFTPAEIARFAHGTTVATNAVIERKGGTVGILTTKGFRDILEIGRQLRQQLYDIRLQPEVPVFLAPGRRRKEVDERIDAKGAVITPLNPGSVLAAVAELVEEGVDAIAICFLFSFLNPDHERQARDLIEAAHPHLKLSLSSDVDPTFREYERTVVTAFDAYAKPVVDDYLAQLQSGLSGVGVPYDPKVMQSRGGLAAAAVARERPVRLFLSGPAAGVIAATAVGKAVGFDNVISVDIGGTSSDIALIQGGEPVLRTEGTIAGYPVRVNMVDINAIGAGGGSIAWLDSGGGLRVGPQSAGADPGPACYGRGGREATVSDASLLLGMLNPTRFAGGAISLNRDAAEAAVRRNIAEPLGLSVMEAALGVHRVVNAGMAEAIRFVSINRGEDPRDFALVALGGAGAIHATALAEELDIGQVVVPRYPGVLSAAGLLAAPIQHDATQAVQQPLSEVDLMHVQEILARLDQQCETRMRKEGIGNATVQITYWADVCYLGQSYHLTVPLNPNHATAKEQLYNAFRALYDQVYGHATAAPAKIVNVRSVHTVPAQHGIAMTIPNETKKPRPAAERLAQFVSMPDAQQVSVCNRDELQPGTTNDGPLIIEQDDSTTIVPQNWQAFVHANGHLLLRQRS